MTGEHQSTTNQQQPSYITLTPAVQQCPALQPSQQKARTGAPAYAEHLSAQGAPSSSRVPSIFEHHSQHPLHGSSTAIAMPSGDSLSFLLDQFPDKSLPAQCTASRGGKKCSMIKTGNSNDGSIGVSQSSASSSNLTSCSFIVQALFPQAAAGTSLQERFQGGPGQQHSQTQQTYSLPKHRHQQQDSCYANMAHTSTNSSCLHKLSLQPSGADAAETPSETNTTVSCGMKRAEGAGDMLVLQQRDEHTELEKLQHVHLRSAISAANQTSKAPAVLYPASRTMSCTPCSYTSTQGLVGIADSHTQPSASQAQQQSTQHSSNMPGQLALNSNVAAARNRLQSAFITDGDVQRTQFESCTRSAFPARLQISGDIKQPMRIEQSASPTLLPYTQDRSHALLSAVQDGNGGLELDALTLPSVHSSHSTSLRSQVDVCINGAKSAMPCHVDHVEFGVQQTAAFDAGTNTTQNTPVVLILSNSAQVNNSICPGNSTMRQTPQAARRVVSAAVHKATMIGARGEGHRAKASSAPGCAAAVGSAISPFYAAAPSSCGSGAAAAGCGESPSNGQLLLEERQTSHPGIICSSVLAPDNGVARTPMRRPRSTPSLGRNVSAQQHSSKDGSSPAQEQSFSSSKQCRSVRSCRSRNLSRLASRSTQSASSSHHTSSSGSCTSSTGSCRQWSATERGAMRAGVCDGKRFEPVGPLDLDPEAPPLHTSKLSKPDLADVNYIVQRWSHRWQCDRQRLAASTLAAPRSEPGGCTSVQHARSSAIQPFESEHGNGTGSITDPVWVRSMEQLHLFGTSSAESSW